jgi:hypothetical protein
MRKKTARRRKEAVVPDYFTFVVHCGFSMQFTFPRKDVDCDPAYIDEAEVTGEALVRLEKELRDYLGKDYAVEDLECEEGVLLGTMDDTEDSRANP